MKRKLITTCFFLAAISSFGQTDTVTATPAKKQAPSMATILTIEGKKIKGWFYRMDDENVYLLPAEKKKMQLMEFKKPDLNDGSFSLPVSRINTIGLQKKNSGLKGCLIGLGIGALTGTIMGFADGDDPVASYTGTFADVFVAFGNAFAMTAEEKALAGGIALGLTGALTGFIIGKLVKKKFIIGGKKETYRDLQGELMKRLIIK